MMTDARRDDGEQNALLVAAQLEKLKLQNEKLRLEVETLKSGQGVGSLAPYLSLLTVLVTIAGFGFGIYQYRAQQQANRAAQAEQAIKDREARELQAKHDTEAAQREFMKPVLQQQLALYLQASTATGHNRSFN